MRLLQGQSGPARDGICGARLALTSACQEGERSCKNGSANEAGGNDACLFAMAVKITACSGRCGEALAGQHARAYSFHTESDSCRAAATSGKRIWWVEIGAWWSHEHCTLTDVATWSCSCSVRSRGTSRLCSRAMHLARQGIQPQHGTCSHASHHCAAATNMCMLTSCLPWQVALLTAKSVMHPCICSFTASTVAEGCTQLHESLTARCSSQQPRCQPVAM